MVVALVRRSWSGSAAQPEKAEAMDTWTFFSGSCSEATRQVAFRCAVMCRAGPPWFHPCRYVDWLVTTQASWLSRWALIVFICPIL